MRHTGSVAAAALMFVLAAGGAATARDDIVDFSNRTTPTCELAGLGVRPPDGWFNVPFVDPPPGHLGCQMLRSSENGELAGILRVRSSTDPAPEFNEEGYARLLAHEVVAVTEMGFVLASEPLWVRDKVPVSGSGFRDGQAIGIAASIDGNDVPQEAHFLLFQSDGAKYLFTLLTPAQASDKALYERNIDDLGIVIRTLQPRHDGQ